MKQDNSRSLDLIQKYLPILINQERIQQRKIEILEKYCLGVNIELGDSQESKFSGRKIRKCKRRKQRENKDQQISFIDIGVMQVKKEANALVHGEKKVLAIASDDSSPEDSEVKVIRLIDQAKSSSTGLWQIIEPSDCSDRYDHELSSSLEGKCGWKIIAASKRGKQHAHLGQYREDTYQIGIVNDWNFIAVADGAGSAELSRVGANLAVDTAFSEFKQRIEDPENNDPMHLVLIEVLKATRSKLCCESENRSIDINELATTLQIIVHKQEDDHPVLYTAQVGDGSMLAWGPPNKLTRLAPADIGTYAGETMFLSHVDESKFINRVHLWEDLPSDTQYILSMTDGIADDFYPHENQLYRLIEGILNVVSSENPEKKLLELISYELRGSFDDRTLAIIYQQSVKLHTE